MKKARRILVGLKTLEHAVALTDLACRLGARNASLFLVHVIELPDPTPLDAEVPDLDQMAKKILHAAERVARRSEMKIAAQVLRAHDAGGSSGRNDGKEDRAGRDRLPSPAHHR